jgi:hypothetical protein
VLVAVTIFGCGTTPASGSETAALPILGSAEEAVLLPWNLKVRARVDTGAAVSSLDARSVQVRRVKGQRVVRFTLAVDGGQRVAVELPFSGYRRVTTSDGGGERRPVVELDVCIDRQRVRAEFTLNDRSRMEYHVLLGRNVLAGRFLVDSGRQHMSTPACPVTP